MSTDQELLELAAKAAGLPDDGMTAGEGGPMSKGALVFVGSGECIDWNPLTDDGDALRLAVKLGMRFDCDIVEQATIALLVPTRSAVEDHREDAFAATRRAIVRAAAEFGKAKL